MKYKRILLKLSGETLSGQGGFGVNPDAVMSVAREVRSVYSRKAQIAVVIGAGNFWRGATKNMDRVTADHIGMIATVMNALALGEALKKIGVPSVVQSAFAVSNFVDKFSAGRAVASLKNKKVVVFGGGIGKPFFTTDTTAAQRASEIKADVLLKATQVDGVYDSDPKKNKKAKRFSVLSFAEAIKRKLKVMDSTAFSICSKHNIPIIVFNFHKKGNLLKVLANPGIGTIIFRSY